MEIAITTELVLKLQRAEVADREKATLHQLAITMGQVKLAHLLGAKGRHQLRMKEILRLTRPPQRPSHLLKETQRSAVGFRTPVLRILVPKMSVITSLVSIIIVLNLCKLLVTYLSSYIFVDKTIGKGTFGKVKLGVHELTNERVAVKILEKDKI